MPNLEIKGYSIDDISKALGTLAIGAYVLGYIVLSYYLSEFGFNPVSPFRPRVLETGICSLLFFAIPVILGEIVASIPSRGLPLSTALSMRILLLPVVCFFSISLPGFLDDLPRSSSIELKTFHEPMNIEILVAGLTALFIFLFGGKQLLVWLWRNYHRKRATSMLVLSAAVIIFTKLQYSPLNSPLSKRTFLWFLIISIFTVLFVGADRDKSSERARKNEEDEWNKKIEEMAGVIQQIEQLREGSSSSEITLKATPAYDLDETLSRAKSMVQSFEQDLAELKSETSLGNLTRSLMGYAPLTVFSFAMLAIAVYSNWVFPMIPLRIGGGEVLPVGLQRVTTDSTPDVVRGGMLDESDQGFFVLPYGHDKGVFIPKERVEAIYFTNSSDFHQITK